MKTLLTAFLCATVAACAGRDQPVAAPIPASALQAAAQTSEVGRTRQAPTTALVGSTGYTTTTQPTLSSIDALAGLPCNGGITVLQYFIDASEVFHHLALSCRPAQPWARLSTTWVDFNAQPSPVFLGVRNLGALPLSVSNFRIVPQPGSEGVFGVDPLDCAYANALGPDALCMPEVTFNGPTWNVFAADLVFDTNDPNQPQMSVHLTGGAIIR